MYLLWLSNQPHQNHTTWWNQIYASHQCLKNSYILTFAYTQPNTLNYHLSIRRVMTSWSRDPKFHHIESILSKTTTQTLNIHLVNAVLRPLRRRLAASPASPDGAYHLPNSRFFSRTRIPTIYPFFAIFCIPHSSSIPVIVIQILVTSFNYSSCNTWFSI